MQDNHGLSEENATGVNRRHYKRCKIARGNRKDGSANSVRTPLRNRSNISRKSSPNSSKTEPKSDQKSIKNRSKIDQNRQKSTIGPPRARRISISELQDASGGLPDAPGASRRVSQCVPRGSWEGPGGSRSSKGSQGRSRDQFLIDF